MVRVELRLLAGMRRLLPEADRERGLTSMEVEQGTTTEGLLDMAGVGRGRTLIVLVNGRYAEPGRALADGDAVSVFPPVAGG